MILKHKLILGTLVTAVTAGTVVIFVATNEKKSILQIDYSSKYISGVNSINESLAFVLKDQVKNRNGKTLTSFGSPFIGVNNKYKTLSINFRKIFSLKENENKKTKLEKIGVALNLVHYVKRYVEAGPKLFKRYNSPVVIPKEYINDKLSQNETIEQIVGIDHPMILSDKRSKAAKYEIDGQEEILLPKVDKKGNYVKQYKLDNDFMNPLFTDPKTGVVKSLKKVSAEEIKESIIYQITKAMYLADKVGLSTRYLNVSNKDFIADPSISDFSYLNQDEKKGVFTSVYGSNVRLLKAIIRSTDFYSTVYKVSVIKSKSQAENLDPSKTKYLHKYDKQGIPLGINLELINNHTKMENSYDWGIIAEPAIQKRENPLFTESYKIEDIIKNFKKDEKTYNNILLEHRHDQKLYFNDRKKYGLKNKLNSWIDFSFTPPKNIPINKSKEYLENIKGYVEYGDFGYKPTIQLSKIHSDSSKDTIIGKIISFNGSSSLGEIMNFVFNRNSVTPSSFLGKIRGVSTSDNDHNGLFELNSEEINYKNNPHSLLSIKHPLIFSTNNDRFTFLNFMKNYRTSIKSQDRVVFNKEDFKRNIFKVPKNATDEELLTFLMLTAKIFDSNEVEALNNVTPYEIPVSGIFAINVGMNEEKVRKILSIEGIDMSKIIFESGHIIIDHKKILGDNIAEKVLKILFRLDSFQFSNLNKVEDNFKTPNAMKFNVADIDSASQKAEQILRSKNFKKMLIKQNSVVDSNQIFSNASESLQDNLEKYYKVMFPLNNSLEFKEDRILKNIKKGLEDYQDDIVFSRLDSRGAIFNLRKNKSSFLAHTNQGAPFRRYIRSNLYIGFEEKLISNSSIYVPSKLNNGSNLPINWLNGNTTDDQIISFILFLHILDKLKIQTNFSINIEKNKNFNLNVHQANLVKTVEELNTIFGKSNISQTSTLENSLKTNIILELKLNHYILAMKKYLEYAYSPGIANNYIQRIDDQIQKI